MEFSQKRGRTRNKIDLLPEGIRVTARALGEKTVFMASYESVLRDPIEFSEDKSRTPIFAATSFALGLIAFVSAISATGRTEVLIAIAVGVALVGLAAADRFLQKFPRTQLFQVSEGPPAIILYADIPDRGTVKDFIAELKSHSEAYVKATYGTAAPYESRIGQLERLAQLREKSAITDEEFESLKAELLGKLDPDDEAHGQYI